MTTKATVTTSMVWVGLLVFLSQGWITVVREWIQKLSGTLPATDESTTDSIPAEPWWEQTRKDEVSTLAD